MRKITPQTRWPPKERSAPAERTVFRLILCIAAAIAIWMHTDFRHKVRESADRASLGAIRCALNFAFVHHRVNNASQGLVVSVNDISRTMDPPFLPVGITIHGQRLQDRRGYSYVLVPETTSMPARVILAVEGSGW